MSIKPAPSSMMGVLASRSIGASSVGLGVKTAVMKGSLQIKVADNQNGILVVSDIHYDKEPYKGVDHSGAWRWLLDILDYHSPEYLLSLGDWGYGASERDFMDLVSRVTVYTIYGNHDDIDLLSRIRNRDGSAILLRDDEIKIIKGLRVAGINGVTSTKRTEKKWTPRKRPEEYLEAARSIASKSGGNLDLLLIHEVPYLPKLFPQIVKRDGIVKTLESIRIVKPKIVLNGHMHSGCYRSKKLFNKTLYIYIDSSQLEKCYIKLEPSENNDRIRVEVWRNYIKVTEINY